jgi:hypothetical protein
MEKIDRRTSAYRRRCIVKTATEMSMSHVQKQWYKALPATLHPIKSRNTITVCNEHCEVSRLGRKISEHCMIMLSEIKLPSTFYFYPFSLFFRNRWQRTIESVTVIHSLHRFSLARVLGLATVRTVVFTRFTKTFQTFVPSKGY